MTLKDLREMSTEQLISKAMSTSCSMTKAAQQQEEKVFRVLSERGVINFDAMKEELKRAGMWQ